MSILDLKNRIAPRTHNDNLPEFPTNDIGYLVNRHISSIQAVKCHHINNFSVLEDNRNDRTIDRIMSKFLSV